MSFGEDPAAPQPAAPRPPAYQGSPPPLPPAGGWAGGPPPVGPPLSGPPVRRAPSPSSGRRSGRGTRLAALLVGLVVAGFVGGLGAGAAFARVSNGSEVATVEQFPATSIPPVERSVPPTTVPDTGRPGRGGSFPSSPSAPESPSPGGSASPGGSQGGLSSAETAAVADEVTPGVVNINTRTGRGEGAGTGMILSDDGLVLTNNHVIEGATEIVVTDADSGEQYRAEVVGTAPTDDVAVIQLEGASGLDAVDTGDSSEVAVGDPVVAIGNAGGRGGMPTVVSGGVVATGQSITVTDEMGGGAERLSGLLQIDAPIEPGDSGGPLANTEGEVVGINTAASADSINGRTTGEGYAIPINAALRIAEQIESGQESADVHIGARGVLGVSVDPTAGTSSAGGPVAGAAVIDVASGSGAEDAGVGTGSVITSLDGDRVNSADALTAAMAGRDPGDEVELGWTDVSGEAHTATVTLGEGPPD